MSAYIRPTEWGRVGLLRVAAVRVSKKMNVGGRARAGGLDPAEVFAVLEDALRSHFEKSVESM
jgi:hypothetical protein